MYCRYGGSALVVVWRKIRVLRTDNLVGTGVLVSNLYRAMAPIGTANCMAGISSGIKEYLRKNPVVYAINSRLKSMQLRAQYQKTMQHYTVIASAVSTAKRWQALSDRMRALFDLGRRGRVLFVGTDEQQDGSGFVQALERSVELTLFRHADGSYGQNHRGDWEVRVARNAARLRELMAESATQNTIPNIVLMQSWASYMSPAVKNKHKTQKNNKNNNNTKKKHQQKWGEE